MANWEGNARSMEGKGERLLIIELNENESCFVLLLVKGDDGTIAANASPRQFTKKDKLAKTFSPEIGCINQKNTKKIPPNLLPFIESETFKEEKEGYVFYHDAMLGYMYHFDTYPDSPQYDTSRVTSIAKLRQNERGKFEPTYEFIKIGVLADPQHRCGNFGKDIAALAKAPLHDSLITDEIGARIIKGV